MIKCLICGKEKEYSIVEHLKYDHNMKSDEYKKKYKGKVKSVKYSKMVSDNNKKAWSNPLYKKKMSEIRKIIFNRDEYKIQARENTKKLWENIEFRQKQIDAKHTEKFLEALRHPDRIKKISETTTKRWNNPEYKKRVSNTMKGVLNDNNGGYRKYLKSPKWEENKRKISDTLSQKIAAGEIGFGTYNHFKNGWYKNEYYQSGLELDTMKFLDNIDIEWTTKHNIRIKYKHPDGIIRNYVPDFLIKNKKNEELIIEMKGYINNTDEIIAKEKAAKKLYNYKIVYSIKELEGIINEFNKN